MPKHEVAAPSSGPTFPNMVPSQYSPRLRHEQSQPTYVSEGLTGNLGSCSPITPIPIWTVPAWGRILGATRPGPAVMLVTRHLTAITLTKVVLPEYCSPTRVSSISSFQKSARNQSNSFVKSASILPSSPGPDRSAQPGPAPLFSPGTIRPCSYSRRGLARLAPVAQQR